MAPHSFPAHQKAGKVFTTVAAETAQKRKRSRFEALYALRALSGME
jgi:hypothetical protein